MNKKYKWIGIVIIAVLAFFLVSRAFATQVDKLYWCHVEPNGNQQTLHLPLSALQNAGHVNANGNPLHAGDHAGACEETTPTPTVTPTATPTPTIVECEKWCDDVTPTPTPTPVDECETLEGVQESDEDCPEVTPTPTEEVTPTPTPEATPQGNSGGGSSNNAPSCSDAAINTAVANPHVFRKGDDARVVWFYDPNVSYRVAIYYGINGQGEQHSVIVDNKPGEYMIHGLGGGDYTFWLQFLNGCNSGPKSQAIVDGATQGWVLFR